MKTKKTKTKECCFNICTCKDLNKKIKDFKTKYCKCFTKNKKIKELKKRFPEIKKQYVYTFLIIFSLLMIAFNFRGQFIVATVNGQPILRTSLIKELEKQAGQKALDSLITKALILQEAKKQGVSVNQEEVDQEITKIEATLTQQGQDLDQLLVSRGMTRSNLVEEIGIQKIIEQLAVKEIEVTDEEIEQSYEQSKDSFPPGEEINPEEIKEGIKEQLKQQKGSEQIQVWLQSLHQEAKINHLLFKPLVNN